MDPCTGLLGTLVRHGAVPGLRCGTVHGAHAQVDGFDGQSMDEWDGVGGERKLNVTAGDRGL